MPMDFARDPAEALYLMGLGFDASIFISAWRGSPHNMPDFGVKMPKGLMLPKKRKSKIHSIEIAARKNFKKYTFKTQFGNYLPFKAYERWNTINERYKAQFELERDCLLAEYDALPNEIRKESEEWIAKVFRSITGANEETKPAPPFSEKMVSMMLSRMPVKRELSKLYRYDVKLQPYFGLGFSLDSGKWPSSNEWLEIARRAIEFKKYQDANLINSFTKITRIQFSKKCRKILTYFLEIVLKQNPSHEIMSNIKEALFDVESLNFFEDKEITRLVSESLIELTNLMLEDSVQKTEKQQRIETVILNLLAYINLNFTDTYERL